MNPPTPLSIISARRISAHYPQLPIARLPTTREFTRRHSFLFAAARRRNEVGEGVSPTLSNARRPKRFILVGSQSPAARGSSGLWPGEFAVLIATSLRHPGCYISYRRP